MDRKPTKEIEGNKNQLLQKFWNSNYEMSNHKYSTPGADIYQLFVNSKYFNGETFNKFVYDSKQIQKLVSAL